MNPLDVVVPFNIFTVYRDRRMRGGLAGEAAGGTPGAGATVPEQEITDCVDLLPLSLPASAETAERSPALAKPATERNPS
jgi:hypothetical protein